MKIISDTEMTEQDILQCLELDKVVYGDQYVVTLQQVLEWKTVNPDIHVKVKDGDKVVAYTNISPVTEQCYEKIKGGDFIDTAITADMLVPYERGKLHSVYFSSVVVHPDYQSGDVFFVIYNAVFNKLLSLAEDGIFIRRIIADAVSEKGSRLCRLFGMQKLKSSDHNSMLYEVQMLPPKFRVASALTKRLFDIYQAHLAK